MMSMGSLIRCAIFLFFCSFCLSHASNNLVYIDDIQSLKKAVDLALDLCGDVRPYSLQQLQRKLKVGVQVFSPKHIQSVLQGMRTIFAECCEDHEVFRYLDGFAEALKKRALEGLPARSFTVTADGVVMLSALFLHELGIDVQQTAGTDALNIGSLYAEEINIGVSDADQSINIGTGTGTTNITIGSPGDTVTIIGDISAVINPTIGKILTLNENGAVGSASNSGIELEEDGVAVGYVKTDGSRDALVLKTPATAGVVTIVPGASGFTIDQASHDPLSLGTANGLSLVGQELSIAVADDSTTGVLSSDDWNLFNNKQSASAALGALAAYNSNGFIVQIAPNTFTGRTIIGTANQVIVSQGDGLTGDPIIALPQDVAVSSTPTFTGMIIADQGVVQLKELTANGSNSVGLQAPADLASDYTITLPNGVGSADDVVLADNGGNLSFGKIVNANIDAAAGIVDTKLATITTANKVANSATTATSVNTNGAIVTRDGSGNFSAGTITASLIGDVTGTVTGSASENVLKAGDTMTGDLVMSNQQQIRLSELTANGSNYVGLQAPADLLASYALTLPVNTGVAEQVLQTDGNGVLSWVDNIGNGDIVSGGNSFGSDFSIGTNDTFGINLETDGTDRIQISSSGVVTLTNLASAGVVHTNGSGVLTTSLIVNEDVAANAAIADTKLGTISAAGKIENSATTATPNNTPNTIVERDGSGNFSAGVITANGLNLGGSNVFEYRSVGIIADSATVSPETSVYIAEHSGLASVFTLTLPSAANLVNGKTLSVTARGSLLTLNLVAGSGTSLSPAINTGIGDQHYTFIYRAADTRWYEI